jgi:hypothetical protein
MDASHDGMTDMKDSFSFCVSFCPVQLLNIHAQLKRLIEEGCDESVVC